jgi:superfamily I DNA/RNA helicase
LRWRDLRDELERLEPIRDDLDALVDEIFPDGLEELTLLRQTALAAVDDAEEISALASAVRYGVSQREVPLEAAEVRVMSMHASKGLTADLVVLAGLVEGIVPRVNRGLSLDEQEAQLQEQRRLFFVAMTRTTNILVFSSYSELEAAAAHRLQVARGPWLAQGAFRTFASSFMGELGDSLPEAMRGEDWEY